MSVVGDKQATSSWPRVGPGTEIFTKATSCLTFYMDDIDMVKAFYSMTDSHILTQSA